MGDSIRHRGPDDSGELLEGPIGAAFRRLSILDLSPEGHQPMLSRDGRHAIVFNGEIFNYVELRTELEQRGHKFRSSGDTEVLLSAWQEWGRDCLPRLNGMFAFAVIDRHTGVVEGARDRLGIKPLYVCSTVAATIVASEIKAILASGMYRPVANDRVVARYLAHGALDESAESFFSGVRSVGAGMRFALTPGGQWEERAWWSYPLGEHEDHPDAPRRFLELFDSAIELQTRSDVPVGVTLSGGLDSTAVICAMAAQRRGTSTQAPPLNAFAYMDENFDESSFVNDTLQRTGANLIPLKLEPQELWDMQPSLMAAQDEPVHSMAATVGYALMRLARRHGTPVVLNGQGADETLAGYPTYFRYHWASLMTRGESARAHSEVAAFARVHGVAEASLLRQLRMRRLFGALATVPGYRAVAAAWRRRPDRSAWLSAEMRALAARPALPPDDIDGSLHASVVSRPLPLYLRMEDRNSMAHSVEARVPFLDWRIVEFAARLPSTWKLRGEWNKYILREAMRDRIPESVRARPDKMGLPTSVQHWFGGTLFGPLRETLGSQSARERGIYDTGLLIRRLDQYRGRRVDFWGPLFRIVQMELWFKQMGEVSKRSS